MIAAKEEPSRETPTPNVPDTAGRPTFSASPMCAL